MTKSLGLRQLDRAYRVSKKDYINKSALAIAGMLVQIDQLTTLPEEPRAELLRNMSSRGQPISTEQAYVAAIDFVRETRLWWFRREHFFSHIYYALIDFYMCEHKRAQEHEFAIRDMWGKRKKTG